MQRLKTISEVSSRLNQILKRADDEENRVMAQYQTDVSRRAERVEGIRNRLTDYGLSVDQVRYATIDPFQGPESGLVTGRNTLYDPVPTRLDSDDKLQKLLAALKIPDSNELARRNIDEIAQRVNQTLKPGQPTQPSTAIYGQNLSPNVTYMNPQSGQLVGQPVRISSNGQRASSVGPSLFSATPQYTSSTSRPMSFLNATTITGTPLSDLKTYGTNLPGRTTVATYPSQSQPSTIIHSSAGQHPTNTSRPSHSQRTTYTPGYPVVTSYQPIQSYGGITYQPTSGVNTSYPMRIEGSLGQPQSNYTSAGHPVATYLSLTGQTIPSSTQQPQPAQTTAGQPSPALPSSPLLPSQPIKPTVEAPPAQVTDLNTPTDRDTLEPQVQAGPQGPSMVGSLNGPQDKADLQDLQDVIHKLTFAKSSLESQLEDANQKLALLESEFALYKTTLAVESSDKEANAKVDEILTQLTDERKETVKMRDLILQQNELIENLKVDVSKRDAKLKESEADAERKNHELNEFKTLVEETTNTMKKYLDENRTLKQQTLIQEYQTKEIVSQNTSEVNQLVQKVYELETELRNLRGDPKQVDSPVNQQVSDDVIQGPDFHIQALSTAFEKDQPQSEGRRSDQRSKTSVLSESEIIENLANFLASTPHGQSRVESDPKLCLTDEQKQNLASMLKDPEVNQAFGSMLSDQLSSQNQKLKQLEDENKILRSKIEVAQPSDSTSPAFSQILKPISLTQTAQLPSDEAAKKFLDTMAKYFSEPKRFRETTQADVEQLASEIDRLNASFQNVEAERDRLAKETQENLEHLASHLKKIEALESDNKVKESIIEELKTVEPKFRESNVISSQSDNEIKNEIEIDDLKKSLTTLQDSERKLQKHLALKEDELKNISTLVEQLTNDLELRNAELSDLQKATIKEAEIINQDNEEKNRFLEKIRSLVQRVQELEDEAKNNETREKANTEIFLQKIAALNEQLTASQVQTLAPQSSEDAETISDIEAMEKQAKALKELVESNPATQTTREEAKKMIEQISSLCNKISNNKSDNDRNEIQKIANLAMKVNENHFEPKSVNQLAEGINQFKNSAITFGNQSATFGSGSNQSAGSQVSQDQAKVIEGLQLAIFELDQSKAGLSQENGLLLNQIQQLTDRLKEAESHAVRGSHIQLKPEGESVGQELVKSYMEQIGALTDKVHRLEVLLNLRRLSDHLLRVSRQRSQEGAQEKAVSNLQNISSIASSLEQSKQVNPEVKTYLNRIAVLANNLSDRKVEIDSNKSVEGSPVHSPEDGVTLEEIQSLIGKVQSAQLAEPAELGQHTEDQSQPEEILKLRQSIVALEDLVSQRDVELRYSHEENIALSQKLFELASAQQESVADLRELEQLRESVFELTQNKAGLVKENELLQIQINQLLQRIKDAEEQTHLARQESTAAMKQQEEPSMESKKLQESQMSNLSADLVHQDKLAELTVRNNQLESDLQAKEAEHKSAQEQLLSLETQLRDLKAETASRIVDHERTMAELTAVKASLAKLQHDSDSLEEKTQALSKRQDELDGREKALAADKEAIEAEKAKLEREKKEIQNLQNQVLDKNEQRLRKFSEQGTGDSDLQARVEKLEKDLKEAKDEKSKVANALRDLETNKKLADIEAMEAKKQREKFERSLRDKIDALTKENTESRKDIKTKEGKIDKLESELYKLKADHRGINEELKKAKAELTKLTPAEPKVTESQTSQPQQIEKPQVQETPAPASKASPEKKQEPKKEEKPATQSPDRDTKRSKKQDNELYKVKESQDVAASKASPVKPQAVQPKEEPKTVVLESKQIDSEKKAEQRKQSHNDGGSWMGGFSDEEDSEDPEKLFKSYVPPASLLSQPPKEEQKPQPKNQEKKATKAEDTARASKGDDTARASKGNDTARASKGEPTESVAFTESQVTKRSKVSQPSESKGGRQRRGKARQYDDDNEDEYYVKKDSKTERGKDEYKEKDTFRKDQRGSKTKREETSRDTERNQGAISSPNRFSKDRDALERVNPIKPTFDESEFVEKKQAKPTQQATVTEKQQSLHQSMNEPIAAKTSKPDEQKNLAKSQQNPINNVFSSPLLRIEDLEGYHEEGDGLFKLSEISTKNFGYAESDPEEKKDKIVQSPEAATERSDQKSQAISNQAGSVESKKKKKKKGGQPANISNSELEWIKRMGKN